MLERKSGYGQLERAIVVLLFFFAHCGAVYAQDAQWRGPDRDGKFPDLLLLREWPEEGPELLFTTEGIGKGFSSAVATRDMIYVTGIKDTIEYVTAMDLEGNILWQKPFGRSWNQSFPESRCTPAVDGDRVYVLTGMDNMVCFNAKTGAEIWSVDIHEKYNSHWDMFGVSESLLLVDDKVIATPAGESTTVIALDKMTGELVWKSESMGAQRSNLSPALIEHCGQKYIITATRTHTLGVDPENGEILWTYHYNILDEKDENTTIQSNTPVYLDSCLWITSGWDKESVMLEIAPDGRSVTEKYIDHTFDNQNHGVVVVDGHVYGSNFTGRQSGKWVCLNWHTGEIIWLAKWHNKGPIIYADGMLYCYEEKRGNMALVKADPDGFKVISSFRVKDGNGPHWARPAIYNGMLLVRHGELLISYKVKS
ncbi:MAG: PQQ-binding-like beta-propeller repeat protein [Bacteroidales bacterium]|nr:PQQ-binding-like beta-propeller repeat protein [Bacteroidales bacterium]